jgi:sec-independent protein translocase protein TatA
VSSGLLQPSHLLVLLVVVLIVFGPKRLPQLGRSLGEGLRSLKGGLEGHLDGEEKPEAPTEGSDRGPTS